ncbi:unnamed protein product [Amoebophrya sp. A25]|nr:unnamed protein product [Amoebophrya sp. A25]|eukprot:GSA25T00011716001.1
MPPKKGRSGAGSKRAILKDDDSDDAVPPAAEEAPPVEGDDAEINDVEDEAQLDQTGVDEEAPQNAEEDAPAESPVEPPSEKPVAKKRERLLPAEDEEDYSPPSPKKKALKVQFSQEIEYDHPLVDPTTGRPITDSALLGPGPGTANGESSVASLMPAESGISQTGEQMDAAAAGLPSASRGVAQAAGGAQGSAASPDSNLLPGPSGEATRQHQADAIAKMSQQAATQGAGAVVLQSAPGDVAAIDTQQGPLKHKPRLMIKTIILENFKSYGTTREIGPFHHNFSAIIGPNGSGKSNTIDALQFVFGKSAKKIRLSKLSELIHSSKHKKDLQYCKVSVHFQDIVDVEDPKTGLPYTVVPDSEIVVGRQATRKNNSDYLINGKIKKREEVIDLLKGKGIDLVHNRFLILQGEVEAISLMKPKASQDGSDDGFLEYLEDIIGSNVYIPQIRKHEAAVGELTEERQMALQSLTIAQKARDALDGGRLEAEAWVRNKKSHLLHTAALNQVDLFVSRKDEEKLHADMLLAKEQMAEYDAGLQEYQVKMQEIEKTQKLTMDKMASEKTRKVDLKKAFEAVEEEHQKARADKAYFEEEKVKIAKQIEEAGKNREENLKAAQDAEQNLIPKLEAEVHSYDQIKKNKQKKLDDIEAEAKAETEIKEREKKEKEREQAPLAKALGKLEQEKINLESERDHLLRKVYDAKRHLQDLKNRRSNQHSFMSHLDAKIAGNKDYIKEMEVFLPEAAKALEENDQKIKQKKEAIEQLQSKVEVAHWQLSNFKSQTAKQQAFVRAKAEGKINFIGRLGDLATIDDKYDVAITNAFGKATFDQIVVETTEDATQLVEFVRQNQHEIPGRINCMCLDKMRQNKNWNRPRPEAPAPRLYDLIKVEHEQVKPAFYSILRDTLVAEDIKKADKISHDTRSNNGHRWRVVTLGGDVVEPVGTFVGGGKQNPSRGGLTGGGAQTCEYTEAQLAAMQQDLNKIRAEKDKMEAEQHELKKVSLDEENTIHKQKCDLRENTEKKKQTELNLKTLEQQITDAEKIESLSPEEQRQVDKLGGLIHAKQGEMGKITSREHELSAAIDALKSEIMNAGGDRRRHADADFQKAEKELASLQQKISKEKAQIQSRRKQAEQQANVVETQQKELLAQDENIANEDVKEKDALQRGEALFADMEVNTKTIDDLTKLLDDIEKEHQGYEGDVKKLKDDRFALQNQLTEHEKVYETQKAKTGVHDAELTKCRKEFAELPEEAETAMPRLDEEDPLSSDDDTEVEEQKLDAAVADNPGKQDQAPEPSQPEVDQAPTGGKKGAAKMKKKNDAKGGTGDKGTGKKGAAAAAGAGNAPPANPQEPGSGQAAEQVGGSSSSSQVPQQAEPPQPKKPKRTPEEKQAIADLRRQRRLAAAVLGANTGAEGRNPIEEDFPEDIIVSLQNHTHVLEMLRLEGETKTKKKNPNLEVIKEYRQKAKIALKRQLKYEDANRRREETRLKLEDEKAKRKAEFMLGYEQISNNLKMMYQMLTMGGDAEFELVEQHDPFSEGVAFSVRPPKKSWKQIQNLSGGEKTLASLSLVFALHQYRPTPLYFMDEIDAALDTRNVGIIAQYIKRHTKNAQFIIISLRNQMFELADYLVGICKVNDISNCTTLSPGEWVVPPTIQRHSFGGDNFSIDPIREPLPILNAVSQSSKQAPKVNDNAAGAGGTNNTERTRKRKAAADSIQV